MPHLPAPERFVAGHPVAGTEHSGPEAAFEPLFRGRHCILTPLADTDPEAVAAVTAMWQAAGMRVETMTPEHHDRVLAITSHLPHLIAYCIVGTVADLEDHLQTEVLRYAAGGFTDFTRIAGSDPVMWRDVFLNNREAVLEMLGRFSEDLAALQRSIRWGEGDKLEELFTRTRAIRRGVIAEGQAYDRQALTERRREPPMARINVEIRSYFATPVAVVTLPDAASPQPRARAGDPGAREPGSGRPAQQSRRLAVELGLRGLGRRAGQAAARRARATSRRG